MFKNIKEYLTERLQARPHILALQKRQVAIEGYIKSGSPIRNPKIAANIEAQYNKYYPKKSWQ